MLPKTQLLHTIKTDTGQSIKKTERSCTKSRKVEGAGSQNYQELVMIERMLSQPTFQNFVYSNLLEQNSQLCGLWRFLGVAVYTFGRALNMWQFVLNQLKLFHSLCFQILMMMNNQLYGLCLGTNFYVYLLLICAYPQLL